MSQQHDDEGTVIRSGTVATGATSAGHPEGASGAEDGLSLRIGARVSEFEITQRIGEGGFSIVYLARDHSLDRTVALKEYMPSSLATRIGATQVQPRSQRYRDTFEAGLKSFINEAKLLAQFDHPALVKVYRFWEANGTAYMVMPFYRGVTVKDTIRAMPEPPDEAWLLTLLAPLTEALMVIHAEHCYHRDIAPDNVILLASSGKPLLLDFGAARRVIGDMTQGLTVILKSGYAPIEQYAEIPGMKQGSWTDVYALAALVYWAITGSTPPASVGRMMGDSFVPLARCAAGRYSMGFLQTIDRALVVLPEQRTQTIQALRQELDLRGTGSAPALPSWDDADVTVIRPAGHRPEPSTVARSEPRSVPDGRDLAPRAMSAEVPEPRTRTSASAEHTVAPPRHEQTHPPAGKPAAIDPDEPATRPRRLWFVAAAITTVAVAAGVWWAVPRAVAPAGPTTDEAKSSAPAPPPPAPLTPGAGARTAPADMPGSAPFAAPSAAATVAVPSPAAPVETPIPVTPTPATDSLPQAPPVRAARKAPPADTGTAQSESNPRRAPRVEAAKTERPQTDAANAAECARILQRLSLGDSSAALVDRLKVLNCR